MKRTAAKQRTVWTSDRHERVTVQATRDGTDYFYLETADGQKGCWVFLTRRKLERVREAIDAVLGKGER